MGLKMLHVNGNLTIWQTQFNRPWPDRLDPRAYFIHVGLTWNSPNFMRYKLNQEDK